MAWSKKGSLRGPKGDTGSKGDTGAAGRGVKSTAITYQSSTSGTTPPTVSWTTSVPSVAAGSYLWTRTVITYTDGTTSTSYSVGKMGANGATGPQGPKGDKGDPGSKITVASGAPSGTGSAGDVYVDSATGDLYQYE